MRTATVALCTIASVLMCISVAAQTPAETADQLMIARQSMVGRSFNNPFAVQASLEDNLRDAQKKWGKNSLEAADAQMLLGHATVMQWDKRKLYKSARRIAQKMLPADHPLVGRYLIETAAGLINYEAYRGGDEFLEQAWDFYTEAGNEVVALGQILFLRGLKSEQEKQPEKSAQWFGRAAESVSDVTDTDDRALELATLAYSNAIRVLEMAGKRDAATTYCVAVARLAAVDGNANPQQVLLVPPPYPQELLLKQIEGAVTFAFTVTTEGYIRDVDIESIDGLATFGDALLETIDSWRFSPRVKDGVVVSSRLRNRYLFSKETLPDG